VFWVQSFSGNNLHPFQRDLVKEVDNGSFGVLRVVINVLLPLVLLFG